MQPRLIGLISLYSRFDLCYLCTDFKVITGVHMHVLQLLKIALQSDRSPERAAFLGVTMLVITRKGYILNIGLDKLSKT